MSSSDIARRWLVTFAEMCQKPITPSLTKIWIEQLNDIPPDVLNRAFNGLAKIWTSGFLPTPGNVRVFLTEAEKPVQALIAEESWEKALTWVRRWYLGPDLGFDRNAPELEEKQRRAILAAGGFEHVSACTLDELQWAKKRFVENYGLQVSTEQTGHLIGNSEARRILDGLRSEHGPRPANRQLPAAPQEHVSRDGIYAPSGMPDKRMYVEITSQELQSREMVLEQQKKIILARASAEQRDRAQALLNMCGTNAGGVQQ